MKLVHWNSRPRMSRVFHSLPILAKKRPNQLYIQLKLGVGEFLGTRQSGHLPDLRIADLLRDTRWIARARDAAFERVAADPGLAGSRELLRAVEQRWGERLSLADIG